MAELQLVFNNEKPKNKNVGQQSILILVCRAKSDKKKIKIGLTVHRFELIYLKSGFKIVKHVEKS